MTRRQTLAVLALIGILGLTGCRTIHGLKEQEPRLSYEVEGDYRDLAECTIDLLDSQGTFRSSKIRERRRPPRSIEVYEDHGNLFEAMITSATFYDKGTNRTFIEFRARDPMGDAIARGLEEQFVKHCLRGKK